jgi:hypothetical protein
MFTHWVLFHAMLLFWKKKALEFTSMSKFGFWWNIIFFVQDLQGRRYNRQSDGTQMQLSRRLEQSPQTLHPEVVWSGDVAQTELYLWPLHVNDLTFVTLKSE